MKIPKSYQKKCKTCGKDFQVRFSTLQTTCSVKCAIEYNKSEAKKAEKRKIKTSKELSAMKDRVMCQKRKKWLQDEINKLARMIDALFYSTCICCGKPLSNQTHACHYHTVGSCPSLRYNLHNIHAGRSDCNRYSNTHISGYYNGLAERYDIGYRSNVHEMLPKATKELKLTPIEVKEKLAKVRSIIRKFSKLELENSIQAREMLNREIGIYKTKKP